MDSILMGQGVGALLRDPSPFHSPTSCTQKAVWQKDWQSLEGMEFGASSALTKANLLMITDHICTLTKRELGTEPHV